MKLGSRKSTPTLWILAVGMLACATQSGQNGSQSDLARLKPAEPVAPPDGLKQLDSLIDQHFASHPTARAYIMVDKPLYQPGETIWFRASLRTTSALTAHKSGGINMQLVSPRGSIVGQKRVRVQEGVAANDFVIPDEARGGEYILRLQGTDGTSDERPIIVSSYEPPRLKKTLEFVRKAYGPGDTVTAAVKIARKTGEAFANKTLTGVCVVDDAEVARVDVTTDKDGNATVRFELPKSIRKGDGLLTIMVADGGVTESIQRRVPILLKTVEFSMFPEGGDLVEGLPSRVYFSAENTIGKPADVEGRVVDDTGKEIATFRSVHDGMGRFAITPEVGRSYRVEIQKPASIAKTFELPTAKQTGCVLQAIDNFDSKEALLKVAAFCTSDETVLVEATLREKRLASRAYLVKAKKPALMAVPIDAYAQGALRVTLFNEQNQPLAERLIYRNRTQDLKIAVTAEKDAYSPRDRVTLKVQTTDLAGRGVPASLGLSVVDDTVLSFADDKTAHILAHLYLEPELGQVKVEEPNFYFSDKPEAAAAMDMLLGSKGWRRFAWQQVLAPPPSDNTASLGHVLGALVDLGGRRPEAAEAAPMEMEAAAVRRAPAKPGAGAGAKRQAVVIAGQLNQAPARLGLLGRRRLDGKDIRGDDGRFGAADKKEKRDKAGFLAEDEEWAGGEANRRIAQWALVRVFPAPKYEPGYEGPRTDFRETIFWSPDVRTGVDGTASVTFSLSDSVTSFRITAEGGSAGGLPGRGETVIKSKMPLSLDARLPLEVSAGDKIRLPVTLTNETSRTMSADLSAMFGDAFVLEGNTKAEQTLTLNGGEKRTVFFPLTVKNTAGESDMAIGVKTAGLEDEIRKVVRVVQLGFPFEVSASGTVKDKATHEVDLSGALPGTIIASVKMYPSPLSTMTSGTEGVLRQPGGCFEQASASNYPNIMVMQYLQENDAASPEIVQKTTGYLDSGYKILTGYETKEKGYEWFGSAPGHEALTAYGVMEFEDMAKVYDVDRAMINRTAAWLMKRRDGKGGYQRNSRALDSFGRASQDTTDAYITWALSEAKRTKDLDKELGKQKQLGLSAKDPYHVAIAANTWLNVAPDDPSTQQMVKRLVAMQSDSGAFEGAKQSITMSGGQSLDIETTSLGILAMVRASKDGSYQDNIRSGVKWLNGKRDGYGAFGSTQGTVLSLKALTAYAEFSRQTRADGVAGLWVNGQSIGKFAFEKGHKSTIEFTDFGQTLRAGKNTIEVRLESEGKEGLPYSVAIEYRSDSPQSSSESKIDVRTSLAKKVVKMGEGVRMKANISNKTSEGVPMTIARVGIPGGLTFQTWQLKELRDKKLIDFYETRQREVILYFRALPPNAKKEINLDLMAQIPGTFVAPATSSYLYYTNEHKSWAPPVTVTVK